MERGQRDTEKKVDGQWSIATCARNECEDEKGRKLAEQKRQFWTV